MELNSVLAKVRALIALAEHPSTPAPEAELARKQAHALMLKYAVDEATLEASRPAEQRSKPSTLTIDIGLNGGELTYYVMDLAFEIARHCRCRAVHLANHLGQQESMYVAGFESDLRYFEMLFTQISLHMLEAFFPKVNENESLQENAYRLHNLGLNWLDIAELYGWYKIKDTQPPVYENMQTLETQTATKVGSRIKRAYYKACAERGEDPKILPANNYRMQGAPEFRKNAARGYVAMIGQRLCAARNGEPSTGGALVLRSESLDALMRELFPGAHPITDFPVVEYNEKAYQHGVTHARTADIGGQRMASPERPSIG